MRLLHLCRDKRISRKLMKVLKKAPATIITGNAEKCYSNQTSRVARVFLSV